MAILAVARDLRDLRRRMGRITAAYTRAGEPVTAEDLGAAGAMTVLLKDVIEPNPIQTLEGQPCLMHAGPFANIAHGNSSLIACILLGLKLGEYVITELGFGSDMGMEKLIGIVCRNGGIVPDAYRRCGHGTRAQAPWRPRRGAGAEPQAGAGGDRVRYREPGPPPRDRRHVRPPGRGSGQPSPRGDSDDEVELVSRLAREGGAFDDSSATASPRAARASRR